MNCSFCREQLDAWLDGELEPGLADSIREHLDSCASCREELASIEKLTGLLSKLPRQKAPAELESEVMARIERNLLLGRSESEGHARVMHPAFGAFAAVAAMLLVGLAVYLQFYAGAPESTRAARPNGDVALDRRAPTPSTGPAGPGKPGEQGYGGETSKLGTIIVNGTYADVDGTARARQGEVNLWFADAEHGVTNYEVNGKGGEGREYAYWKDGSARGMQLALVTDDVQAARARILSVAKTLDIRTVGADEEFGLYYSNPTKDDLVRRDLEDTLRKQVWGGADGAGKTLAEAVKEADGRVEVVLVVDERKLPELIAMLVPRESGRGMIAADADADKTLKLSLKGDDLYRAKDARTEGGAPGVALKPADVKEKLDDVSATRPKVVPEEGEKAAEGTRGPAVAKEKKAEETLDRKTEMKRPSKTESPANEAVAEVERKVAPAEKPATPEAEVAQPAKTQTTEAAKTTQTETPAGKQTKQAGEEKPAPRLIRLHIFITQAKPTSQQTTQPAK